MSIPDELRNIRDHLRSGRFGQREVWEQQLEQAAVAVERLQGEIDTCRELRKYDRAEIEQLQREIRNGGERYQEGFTAGFKKGLESNP